MKLTFKYDIGDGPVVVTTRISTIIAWETKYKQRAGTLAGGFSMTDFAFLAHHASVQQGLAVPFMQADFEKKLDLLEFVPDEVDASNPISAAGD